MEENKTIKIKIDENKNILNMFAAEEEERYFIKIEITKEKYEEIKKQLEGKK